MFEWSKNATGRSRGSTSSNNNNNTTSSPNTIRAYTHAQHLDSFLQDEILRRSTRVVPNLTSTYDTVFQTVHQDTLILRVTFDESNVPRMSLAGIQATHPWLSTETGSSASRNTKGVPIVGYEPILSASGWQRANMLLGQAVHRVVQEFQARPPTIQRFTDPTLEKVQPKSKPKTPILSASSDLPPPPDYNQMQLDQSNDPPDTPDLLDMPDIPKHYPELNDLGREALDQLLNDELEFQSYCHQLPIVQTIREMAASLIQDNAQQAQQTLDTFQPQLQQLYDKCHEKQANLQSKVQQFKQLDKEQNMHCQKSAVDPRQMKRELQRGRKQALDESDSLADEWLEDGAPQVDQFVRDFLQLRQKHHVRAAKLELLG